MAVNQINTPPIITKAGVKLATMRNNQHLSLNVTHASFGTSKYNPTGNETALKTQRLKVGILSSVKINDKTIQMRIVVKAAKNQGFWCNEVGFWDGNVLFAIYSATNIEGDGLIFISDKIETTISFSLALEAMPVDRIDVQIMQDVDKLTQIMSLHENEDNPHPQYAPLDLSDETESTKSINGHTHKLPIASLLKRGITKLSSVTNSSSETEAATPKAVKTVKDQLDSISRNQANYIPNSKKSSSLTSNSADTVATSSAVKQLNDKITPLNFYKVNVKAGNTPVTFDLSNREHWIAEIGSVYKGTGHYQLGLHNNATSTITNLPLNDKSAVQLDISVMGAYSLIRCHYLALNRTFTSRFDWNKSTFPLAWFEEVKLDSNGKVPRETVFARSLESNYRVVIRRNEAKYTPYQMLVDNSVDMTAETVPQKSIGELTCRAGAEDGVLKSLLKTILLADKNATVEMGGWDASQRYKIFLKGFTKTNNVVIGSGTDNARDLLQVNGTVKATAPADGANNDQVPNTFWVRRLLNNAVSTINNAIAGKVSKSGDSMTGMLTLPKLSLTQRNIAFGDDYLYKNNANNAQHGFHLFEDSGEPNDNKKGNARFFVNEIRTNHIGQGAYAAQYHSFAPFFVDESGSVSRDTYHPFVKGKVRSANQYGAAFSLGYTTYQGAQGTDGWGKGVIHLIEDNGKERSWTFEHNGNFWSPGDVIAASGKSINGSVQHTDLVGEVAFFARANPPNGWLKANGAAVSRTTYSALFAAIGTTFGAGDGHSTFNLPDLRGEFIRGLDEGRRVDNGRRLGSHQGDAIRNITGQFNAYRRTDKSHLVMPSGAFVNKQTVNGAMGNGGSDNWAMTIGFDASRVVPTAGENRPRNIALLACIKY